MDMHPLDGCHDNGIPYMECKNLNAADQQIFMKNANNIGEIYQ